ncbi:MAG: hypothetical protein HOV81_10480 [Kofleriaceae bacterium]|nr:hypothetical protein [Kofleriaceae bacterium]
MGEHVDAARKPSVYVVVAYRWGKINEHQYVVTATADRAEAVAAAREECDGRGLKYGVEVVEYPGEETVAYFPSSAEAKDATGPEYSADVAAANHVGFDILVAFQRDERWVPSGKKIDMPNGAVDTLKSVPAAFPEWLSELCQRALEMFRRG